jgi:hypothetical protein
MDAGVTINRPPRDSHMAFVRSPDNIMEVGSLRLICSFVWQAFGALLGSAQTVSAEAVTLIELAQRKLARSDQFRELNMTQTNTANRQLTLASA